MRHKEILGWAIVLTGCAAVMSLPFLYYRVALGTWNPAIHAQEVSDSLYYLTQVQDVLKGHPFLGNPYVREYAERFFPGLLLPVWLASVPGFLGFSINSVYVVNAFFYALLTAALLYFLCMRVAGGNRLLLAAVIVLLFPTINAFILRTAIVQTVYPFVIVFLYALYGCLEQPHTPLRYVLLGVLTALSFYLYPYFWMMSFTAVGLLGLSILWRLDRTALKPMVLMSAGIGILCIPEALTIFSLFHDPLALQLNERTGMMATRIIHPLTIANNKYIILLLIALFIIRMRRALTAAETLLALTGGGLLIAAVSNVVTGKQMDFATHFWRMGLILQIVSVPILAQTFFREKTRMIRLVTGLCLFALLFTTLNRSFIYVRNYAVTISTRTANPDHVSFQEFTRIFAYFEEHDVRHRVVLSHDVLASYIPLYSDNTPLFSSTARYHVIPTDEQMERFVIGNVDAVNREFLATAHRDVLGIGPYQRAIYMDAYPERSIRGIASPLLDAFLGVSERPPPSRLAEVVGEDFVRKTLELRDRIDRNYEEYLRQYGADYIIVDAVSPLNPRVPKSSVRVYSDNRFTIYRTAWSEES